MNPFSRIGLRVVANTFFCDQIVIQEMKARLKDPDLARLFENTFPNTLGETRKLV